MRKWTWQQIKSKIKNRSSINVWGSPNTLRDFLHVDDLADACVFLLKKKYFDSLINIGSGKEISILNLLILMKKIITI